MSKDTVDTGCDGGGGCTEHVVVVLSLDALGHVFTRRLCLGHTYLAQRIAIAMADIAIGTVQLKCLERANG
jgi:hypothetical protein